jgi:hypothetical protein
MNAFNGNYRITSSECDEIIDVLNAIESPVVWIMTGYHRGEPAFCGVVEDCMVYLRVYRSQTYRIESSCYKQITQVKAIPGDVVVSITMRTNSQREQKRIKRKIEDVLTEKEILCPIRDLYVVRSNLVKWENVVR